MDERGRLFVLEGERHLCDVCASDEVFVCPGGGGRFVMLRYLAGDDGVCVKGW